MNQDRIAELRTAALAAVAAASTPAALDELKVRFLGRQGGEVTAILRGLGQLAPDQRKPVGAAANALRGELEQALAARLAALAAAGAAARGRREALDVTLPGTGLPPGRLHPTTLAMRRITDIFLSLGFRIAEGPEVELDYYNFEALNFGKHHPARDAHDTFYVGPDTLLRTHTSPVQVRVYESQQPPVRIIAPGKVYRADYDITHIPMFHQVEGFWVEEGINFGHLKGILELFLKRMFGAGVRTRFRPSYFPFTEPSAEIDVSCFVCQGQEPARATCRICKGTGWIEIGGCGMVHPAVLDFASYDTEKYTGFAFGMGVERIAMLRWGIDDIRLFYENDRRFLRQFGGGAR